MLAGSPDMFSGVQRMFRGSQGVFSEVQSVLRVIPGVFAGMQTMFRLVPGVFSRVPGMFRVVPGELWLVPGVFFGRQGVFSGTQGVFILLSGIGNRRAGFGNAWRRAPLIDGRGAKTTGHGHSCPCRKLSEALSPCVHKGRRGIRTLSASPQHGQECPCSVVRCHTHSTSYAEILRVASGSRLS